MHPLHDIQGPIDSEKTHLNLGDTISIIFGIVIGAGIYETAPLVFQNVANPEMGVWVWGLGGLLSLVGALCYAELASTYPRHGGDYVYLSRAYGRLFGFLFGWAQLVVLLTGSIGMMAFVFADYAASLWTLSDAFKLHFALGAIILLSFSNALGITTGKRIQNILTGLNVFGLLVIIAVGFWYTGAPVDPLPDSKILTNHPTLETSAFSFGALGFAMIFVLYTFGGWNDAAFVAADVKNCRRNLPRALIIGTGGITVLYVLVNSAYLSGLGLSRARESEAIAADLLSWSFGSRGADLMAILVMLSALGAVNGLILTGSRVYQALGADHEVFFILSRRSKRTAAPLWAIYAQALVSCFLVIVVRTAAGRSAIEFMSSSIGLTRPTWSGHGGFESLMRCTAPMFWFFFLATGLSVFILRAKDHNIYRPFKVPLYPWLPLVFCGTCAFMLYKSAEYAGTLTLIGCVFVVIGIPVYVWSNRHESTVMMEDSRLTTKFSRKENLNDIF